MSDHDAPPPRLRHSARALVIDSDERILLLRVTVADGVWVWIAPGGGLETGESPLDALRRELVEEIGLRFTDPPPHVWHQRIVEPGHIEGYDGVVNDFYLVRTEHFAPRGTMSPEQLRAELVYGHRWWGLDEIQTYAGADFFGPRKLGELLIRLLRNGAPPAPISIGL
jgi:8-oxo-dGTP diphosphatase